jgi:hypothetical protein
MGTTETCRLVQKLEDDVRAWPTSPYGVHGNFQRFLIGIRPSLEEYPDDGVVALIRGFLERLCQIMASLYVQVWSVGLENGEKNSLQAKERGEVEGVGFIVEQETMVLA